MAPRVRSSAGVLSFHLRLTPKGGRDAIDGWCRGADGAEYLKARVAAAAENGNANAALLALLAKTLGVAKSTVCVASGHHARLKRIEISPATAVAAARLAAMESVT